MKTIHDRTNYTKSTTSLEEAITSLMVSSIGGLYRNRLTIRKCLNDEVAYPVTIVNPALDDVLNWTTRFGVPYSYSKFVGKKYDHPTEKLLSEEYVPKFLPEDIRDEYLKTGKLPDKCPSMGICTPVKRVDVGLTPNIHDPSNRGWYTTWEPKKGVPFRVPDPDIEYVFVLYIEDEHVEVDLFKHLHEITGNKDFYNIKNSEGLTTNS
jgi:hypothetical protein